MRQAAFKGVREDKPPQEVVREMPAADTERMSGKRLQAAGLQQRRRSRCQDRTHGAGLRVLSQVRSLGTSKAGTPREQSPDESDVRFTHPDRVYWADVGVTKQDLADYYRAVWDWMAPQVVGRPLALVRCPDGTKGECFFQKHASAGLDDKYLRTVIDKHKRQIIAVEDLEGLLSLVQAGVLEIHVRGSTIDRLDLCDRIVFDLDPGEGVAWAQVVAAARDVRERLAASTSCAS